MMGVFHSSQTEQVSCVFGVHQDKELLYLFAVLSFWITNKDVGLFVDYVV